MGSLDEIGRYRKWKARGLKTHIGLVFRNFGLVNYDPELLTELGRKFRVIKFCA
jgi:hypothetical protein